MLNCMRMGVGKFFRSHIIKYNANIIQVSTYNGNVFLMKNSEMILFLRNLIKDANFSQRFHLQIKNILVINLSH